MAGGIALTTGVALSAAAVYATVAVAVARREVGPPLAWANACFAVGWGGLAAMLASDAARLATGIYPPPDPTLYLVLVQVKILATAAAIGGFGTYVLFLHSGRAAWSWPPAVVVAALYAFFFLALTQARLPIQVEVGTWATRLRITPGPGLPGGDVVGLGLFFLPLLVITVLYFALWCQLATRMQHWRLAAVGASLVVFLVASSIQSNPNVSADTLTVPIALVVLLATGVFSLWSFHPPAWLRARLEEAEAGVRKP